MIHNYSKIFTFFLLIFTVFSGCKETTDGAPAVETKEEVSYNEKHRPQFHFTPKANWMNDPNGMYYYQGKYHLFYQYFPDSTVWGPMHWGHAESNDMVHWNHKPIALYPDSIGCIFSGSAVVDNNNTSNLGTSENPPIIAAFTHHNFDLENAKTNDHQKQSIAYSVDGGESWKKYKGNPVIPNTDKIKDFRDPKIVWHEASQKWILALAAYDKVMFYSSPNLKEWKFISDFGIEGDNRLWECPDLFPMKVEGSEEEKWVLIVSIQKEAPNDGTATSYFIGDFDGEKFQSDINSQKWLDWGADNYASVTWNNVPQKDGRILALGWMSNWQYAQIVPTETWRSAMTLPRELKLVNKDKAYYLYSSPVTELEALRNGKVSLGSFSIEEEKNITGDFVVDQSEYIFEVDMKNTSASTFGFTIGNKADEKVVVSFDKKAAKMFVDRTQSSKNKFSEDFYDAVHSAPLDIDRESLTVRMYIDAASVEIFIGDGEMCFTDIFFPTNKYDGISMFSKDGKCVVSDAVVFPLKSIWTK